MKKLVAVLVAVVLGVASLAAEEVVVWESGIHPYGEDKVQDSPDTILAYLKDRQEKINVILEAEEDYKKNYTVVAAEVYELDESVEDVLTPIQQGLLLSGYMLKEMIVLEDEEYPEYEHEINNYFYWMDDGVYYQAEICTWEYVD